LPRKRTMWLSGWAADASTRYRFGTDEALPLSDHADFDELITYVKRVEPKKVYTVHGFDEFPSFLRQLGFDAEPLRPRAQLSLF